MSLKHVLLVSCALLGGCGIFAKKGPTDVARGEYYAAGKPSFDAFFIRLHDLQVELLAAPEGPRLARANLAHAVGSAADASDETLRARWSQELKQLELRGQRVRLELPTSRATDASATLHTSSPGETSPLLPLLREEATRLIRSLNRMLAVDAELDKLRVTGLTLEGSVDSEFRTDGPWKRSEVRANLSDGQKLLTLMQARAREVASTSRALLDHLAEAATTDPSLGTLPSLPPAVEPAPAPKPPRRPAPRAAPSRPAAPPARAPASKPRADEEAAPKPVQGSAPAEIEP